MGRLGTGAGRAGRARGAWPAGSGRMGRRGRCSGRGLSALGLALGLAVLSAACAPGATGDGGGAAPSDSLRFAHTLTAAPGPEVTGPGGGTALPGATRGLVWARMVSPEATDRLAAHYCAELVPFGPAPWRIPAAAELAGAPLDRFPFVPGDILWTVDRPQGAHHRRVVLDPLTGAPDSRAPSQALHLRVLCVAEAP